MPKISRHLGLFDSERSYALGLHRVYRREMIDRVFAAFANIESEAKVLAESEYHRLLSQYDPDGSGDLAVSAEIAQGRAEEHYRDLIFVQDRVVEIAVTGLYHMWERRVRGWLTRDGNALGFTRGDERTAVSGDFEALCRLFMRFGWDITNLAFFPILDELRLVANTIKHGEGRSCQELFDMRRGLFWPYSILGDGEAAAMLDGPYRALSLNAGHFEEYASAVEAFWVSVPSAEGDNCSGA